MFYKGLNEKATSGLTAWGQKMTSLLQTIELGNKEANLYVNQVIRRDILVYGTNLASKFDT